MSAVQKQQGSNNESVSLDELLKSSLDKVELADSSQSLEHARVELLGKSGSITSQLKKIGSLPPEERKDFGANLNKVKQKVAEEIEQKKSKLELEELNKKLESEKIDVTLAVNSEKFGKIHPISQVIEEIIEIFGAMGFAVAEGPEIEDEYHNFTALNIKPNHPARQMHDTFYVEQENTTELADQDKRAVLRTHTSPVQVRYMKENKDNLPIQIIAPGKTYRCDSDQTHTPMFHQVEGLYIAEEVNMAMLKACIQEFVDRFFARENIDMRFRSSFFPFTEPSAEVDIQYEKKGNEIIIGQGDSFLEILGCGMVHPNVLENAGIDSKKYKGFAFGMGIERLAMLKYGISDLRTFFETDKRWIDQYSFDHFDVPKLLYGW
jgi:phenylalanyl-tRNA synthetase alpha chain